MRTTLFFALFYLTLLKLHAQDVHLSDYVEVVSQQYEYKGETKVAVRPTLKPGTPIVNYSGRFWYLLTNIPAINQPDQREKQIAIKNLFPDSVKIEETLLNAYRQDSAFMQAFKACLAPITNANYQPAASYSQAELMNVASRFFYAEAIQPDTSVFARFCASRNGIKEADWNKDYALLEAFCYEAIMNDIQGNSDDKIQQTFDKEKDDAALFYRSDVGSLDTYLLQVRQRIFDRMAANDVLLAELMDYYEKSKDTLPFTIED